MRLHPISPISSAPGERRIQLGVYVRLIFQCVTLAARSQRKSRFTLRLTTLATVIISMVTEKFPGTETDDRRNRRGNGETASGEAAAGRNSSKVDERDGERREQTGGTELERGRFGKKRGKRRTPPGESSAEGARGGEVMERRALCRW